LKHLLWPLLEGLAGSPDVQQFRIVLPAAPGVAVVPIPHAAGQATRSSKMKPTNSENSLHPKLAGEGTRELLVHIVECPLTMLR
jgi:hypothetical protein